MNIGNAIFYRLTTTTAVSALVGTRVYPEFDPDDDNTYPLIVYEVGDIDADTCAEYGRAADLQFININIVCITKDYDSCVDLAVKVETALDAQRGSWGGVVVQGAYYEPGTNDQVVTISDAQEVKYCLRELPFFIAAEA